MDNTPPLSITLTQEELYIILSQLKSQNIEGLGNHWRKELNPTNLAMALDIAMRSLIARGICKPVLEANRIRLSPGVIALVGVCSSPEMSINLLCQRSGENTSQYYFHFAQKLYVAHTIPFTAIHSFLAFQSQTKFQEALLGAANIPEAEGDDEVTSEITVSGFEKARQMAEGGKPHEAHNVLRESGLLKTDMARELAEILASPDYSLSVARQDHAKDETEAMTLLGGKNRLWMFTNNSGGDKMIVKIISSEQVKSKLQGLAAI